MGNCAVRGQGKGLEGAEVGARSACGFCSDLALCSVRAEREKESERVRACVRGVCTYDCRCQGVGASLPFWVVLPLSSLLWKGLPVFPCFSKCRTWPFLSGIPFQASSHISISPLSAHPPVCAVRGVRSPLPGASPLVSGDGTKESWYLALTRAVSGAAQETFCPQIAPLPPGLNQQAPS